MKWFKGALLVVLSLVVVFVAYAVATALRSARPVGFQATQLDDGAGGRFAAGIWYPTDATPWPTTPLGLQLMDVAVDAPVAGRGLPVVVISHGNGGGIASHADLAMALAGAGYVVVAPMHAGDNFQDQHAVGSLAWLPHRNLELRRALDFVLSTWPAHAQVDPTRIGAYGFSAGGFTVLTALGAQPDMHAIATHCAQQREFVCDLLARGASPLLHVASGAMPAIAPDPRIHAAVIAAPGFGFTMAGGALTNVTAPVQLWNADADVNVPYATNAGVVRAALRTAPDYHGVPGARHLSFLIPCGLIGPPALCADNPGFDRKAFHAGMNASVVAFFNRTLAQRPADTTIPPTISTNARP